MANTPEQTQYDTDLAALNKLTGSERVRAKENFDLKYPKGRPGTVAGISGSPETTDPTDASIAAGLSKATNLGIGEALLLDPTYGDQLQAVFKLYKTNKTAAADLLFKSKWAKLDTDARDRYLLKIENSDLYQERLKSWLVGVKRDLATRNLTVSDKDLADYYLKGIDNTVIIDEAISGLTTKSGDTTALTNLRMIAEANGLNLDTDFAKEQDSWLQAIARGEDANKFYNLIRNKAGEGQSEFVKNLLKTGKDLEDIYKPYIDKMASTFGVAVSTIKPNDSLLKDIFSEKGGISLDKFDALLRTDPRYTGTKAAFGAADVRQRIRDNALSQGVTLSDEDVEDIYNNSIAVGGGDATIKALVRAKLKYTKGGTLGGAAGEALTDLKKTAKANGLDFDKQFGDQAQTWISKIAQGESPDTFKNIIRQTAKLGLPEKVGSLLDFGIDLETIYSPYKNVMASVLEINPQTIGLDDKTLRSAIGPDKEMTIYDWERSLRKDPRWQYTNNAREEVSGIGLNVLRQLGFQG
jgi:hypothetical protein